MVLPEPGAVLTQMQVPVPRPDSGQVLIKVTACGGRTDLHILDGDLKDGKCPLIPGHEVVGKVIAGVSALRQGDVVGVTWLAYTCGKCRYCRGGKGNLCDRALFTGYTIDGGHAEYLVTCERHCFPIPPAYQHPWAAPLLCAGLIGYRSYRMLSGDCTHGAVVLYMD